MLAMRLLIVGLSEWSFGDNQDMDEQNQQRVKKNTHKTLPTENTRNPTHIGAYMITVKQPRVKS